MQNAECVRFGAVARMLKELSDRSNLAMFSGSKEAAATIE
jgi:hypothetical protein